MVVVVVVVEERVEARRKTDVREVLAREASPPKPREPRELSCGKSGLWGVTCIINQEDASCSHWGLQRLVQRSGGCKDGHREV